MKLIFFSDNGRHHQKLNIKLWSHLVLPLFLFCLITISVIAAKNYYKNVNNEIITNNEAKLLSKFDLLLKKTTLLEAQVQRLNLLGKALANKTKIDIDSFQLNKDPALGGIDILSDYDSAIITDHGLVNSIERTKKNLALQEASFSDVKNSLHSNDLKQNTVTMATSLSKNLKLVSFFSSPVRHGYISSFFGKRRDPINGHQRHHNGIDIAAKHGSEIHSIASGFVTFIGRKGGYGNVVEIHHSDTLKSRYAHLHEIDVTKGDVVRKGDIIATMGSTGRATGSHLHLEVWEDGKAVNPESYIDTVL
jgi:murein DD-endopeptidase MepM/ murein hydrolase activator NlpD